MTMPDEIIKQYIVASKIKRDYGYISENFEAYFWFVGWSCISLGLHIDPIRGHLQIHLPFGFIHIGRPL